MGERATIKWNFAANADDTASFWVEGLDFDRTLKLVVLAGQLRNEQLREAAEATTSPLTTSHEAGEG